MQLTGRSEADSLLLFTVLEPMAVRAGRNFRVSLVRICPSSVHGLSAGTALGNQLHGQTPVGSGGGGRVGGQMGLERLGTRRPHLKPRCLLALQSWEVT